MIDIKDKKDCCGCNACYDICPKDAISLETDIEGFWYPKVDMKKCIDCHLCEKTCPQLHVVELKHNEFEKPICFAAIHKSIETRFASTTGGMFSALAEQMYSEGGYVGGAIYREDWSVAHFISNNPEDLQRLRQSKYSQSDTRDFYKAVKRLLLAGEKVLVCGSPCQMAALRRFLGKNYDTLIIVDYICKSITSPKFYQKYLDFWERKASSKLVSFKFKDKELGWRNLVKRFDFKNGKTMYSRAQDNDLYSSAYHGHIASRPSCYDCQFKGFPRMADITIADFWGCEKKTEYRELDDNAGTSVVIINNQHGLDFFEKIKMHIKSVPAKIEDVIPRNPALLHSEVQPKADREAFFRDLDKEPIENVVPRYVGYFGSRSSAETLKGKLKLFYKIARKAWHQTQGRPKTVLQFLYLNLFCNKVKTDFKHNGIIYPTPYTVIELQRGSVLELHSPLVVGNKKVRKSRVETRLLLERNARMIVNDDSHFGYGSDVEVFANAVFTMDHCGTNYNCTIICGKRIEMHGSVSLGRDVSIRDTNAHMIAIDGYKILRPVIIEGHVWLCSGATICPGVKIKAGAIIGADSYVIQNVPAHALVSGNPAKVVQHDIAWKL
jgi:acetyltransferase-like isoleucine patch superfamily enzyme/coenzyme F420-reducing hydrogenase beta subunit